MLALLCQRYERKAIAERLHVAYGTVGKHCQDIFACLGVHSEYEAILTAFHRGWYYPLASLTPQVNILLSQ